MPDKIPTCTPDVSALQTAFQSIAESVAASIVDALMQPLRQEIESRVNTIIAEATKDIHHKIAIAIGQIQPIQIPISLLAQPVVQPHIEAVAAPIPAAPIPIPAAQPAPIPPAPEAAPPAPDSTQAPFKRDKERTPKKSSRNLAATIVGLLPGQAHMIKNDFKFAKLAFISADARNNSQLVALSKSHNPVIFMTDFIRHASVESVRSVNGNWVYVTGGMGALRDKLHELHQRHQDHSNPLIVVAK